MNSLKLRFENFIRTYEGFESIDKLLEGRHVSSKRADYLLKNRSIIIEQKSIEIDPKDKVSEVTKKLVEEHDIRLCRKFEKKMILDSILNTSGITRTLQQKISRQIYEQVESSEKQIKKTRLIFPLQNSMGFIVFLNQSAPTLAPRLVASAIADALHKRYPDGRIKYENVAGVILISETHIINLNSNSAFPAYSIANSNYNLADAAGEFGLELIQRWTEFNGRDYVEVKDISEMSEVIYPR